MKENKRLEDNQLQDKAKAKAPIVEKKEVKEDQAPQPQRDFFSQAQKIRPEMFSSLYKEPVYQIMEKIKNKPYFR